VLDAQSDGLLGLPAGHLLDGLVFASAGSALSQVWVAGRQGLTLPRTAAGAASVRSAFEEAMWALWRDFTA
jgi:formimidoylglutamate deiminase